MSHPRTPPITLYGIVNCDTVKKARAWLTDQGLSYEFHDFKKQGLPQGPLDHWLAEVGWDKLLNRKGTTWRRLDASVQALAQDAVAARALMLEQPSVIKRPVVQWGEAAAGRVSVGFDAAAWAALAAGARRH